MAEAEEKTIEECVKLAHTIFHLHGGRKDIKMDIVTIEEAGLVKTEQVTKRLFTISSPEILDSYCDVYSSEWHRRTGKAPENIIIKDCYLRLGNMHGLERHFSFIGCKIDFKAAISGSWIIHTISNSEISMAKDSPHIAVKQFDSSICHGHIFLVPNSYSRQILDNDAVTIQNCIFDQLTCYASHRFYQCAFQTLEVTANACEIHKAKVEALVLSASPEHFIIKNAEIGHFRSEKINFSAAIFSGITFKSPPLFRETIFAAKNVDFEKIIFRDQNSAKALGAFRSLKHLCEDAGYEAGAVLFHGHELETNYNLYLKRNCPASRLPEKYGAIFHRTFTNYGRDLLTPWLSLLLFLALGWLCALFAYPEHYGLYEKAEVTLLHSFRNSIGPLFFALPEAVRNMPSPTKWFSIISFVQLTVCSIIWFIGIFMLRRRFKL